jgi:hypothetical protein
MAGRAGLQLRLGIIALQPREPVSMISIPEKRVLIGKFHMHAPRPMTRFAANVNFRKRRVVACGADVEISFQVR